MICPLSAGEEIRKNQSTEILCTLQHLDYVEEVIRLGFVCERGGKGGGSGSSTYGGGAGGGPDGCSS